MSFVIDKTLEINAPADIVWEVITDLSSYGEWNPFMLEAKSTLKVGDPIDMKVKLLARPQAQREWISAFTAGKSFEYRMKPMPLGALKSRRSHTVDKAGAQRTRYRSYFEIDGWLKPLILMMFKNAFYTGFGGMSEGIKQRAEKLWAERKGQQRA